MNENFPFLFNICKTIVIVLLNCRWNIKNIVKYFHESTRTIYVGWIPRSLFFPDEIFSNPNRVSDSVSDADSRDIKILVEFPGNPILEISIKIRNCVGNPYMRGRSNMKVRPIAIFNCPVILGYF